VFNVLEQIASQAVDEDLVKQSIRMTKRAGVPMEKTYLEKFANDLGKTTDSEKRRQEALERKQWEEQRATTTSDVGSNVAENLGGGRSALSRREGNNGKPDMFMNSVLNPDKIATVARDKNDLQKEMNASQQANVEDPTMTAAPTNPAAANRVSELIAKAGAGASFEGESLGIGGLDDVLAQVKRRVWTPLAAPPQLLEELGIHPVRGLLLYGKPGCGKTHLGPNLVANAPCHSRVRARNYG
jgi:ATP-dependent 26S proteasome regulatory subunit